MEGNLPPVTRGESLNVLSWTLLCITILSKLARFGSKYVIARKLEWDDLMALLALILSAGQTIAMSMETANGLGSHLPALSTSDRIAYQKASYASDMLFVAALWASKVSTNALVKQMNPFGWESRLVYGTSIFLVTWAVTAIIALAFQCALPHSWEFIGNRCFDRTYSTWISAEDLKATFHSYLSISNIITESVVVVVPIIVLWKLNVARARKAAVLSCFSARLVTIVATISQMIYSRGAYSTSDPTYDTWRSAICTQIVQNLCVISCSVPYLKPFYKGLQSGMIRSDDLRRRHTGGSAQSDNGGFTETSVTPKRSR